jgi:hypothetical protein
MRVHIGPYKDWLGPYQLAEKIMFWVPKEKDEYGFPHTAERVRRFGEWLAHGSIRPERELGEETDAFSDDRKETWIYKLLQWIDRKKKREIKVHIDRWDTWSMDSTLGHIIRPMLRQLKATKHGSPFVDDEDVPEHLRSTTAPELSQEKKDTGHVDGNHHARWDWVLDEMIFAFDSLDGGPNQDWEDQFTTGEYDFRFKKIKEDGTSQMVHGPNHTAKTDWDARRAYAERVANGFRLFGKYYQSLWD